MVITWQQHGATPSAWLHLLSNIVVVVVATLDHVTLPLFPKRLKKLVQHQSNNVSAMYNVLTSIPSPVLEQHA